jgi:hypothetical protein
VERGGLMLLGSLSFLCIVVARQPFDPFRPCPSAAFLSVVSLSFGSLLIRFIPVAREPFDPFRPCPSAAFRSVLSLSFGSLAFLCIVVARQPFDPFRPCPRTLGSLSFRCVLVVRQLQCVCGGFHLLKCMRGRDGEDAHSSWQSCRSIPCTAWCRKAA